MKPASTVPAPSLSGHDTAHRFPMNRRLLVMMAVIGVHLLSLWALHGNLSQRRLEPPDQVPIVAELLQRSQASEPPAALPPPAPLPRPQVQPKPPALRQTSTPTRPVVQTPVASTPALLAPQAAPIAANDPPNSAPSPATAQANEAAAASAPPRPSSNAASPARIDLPSSNADYLNNPRPPYPPLSKRMGEQGKVVVRVLIDANGVASQAEIRSSSGYERLDQTALQTVLRWRYIPGKRNGVAEAMWFSVPIHFVLE